MAPTQSPNAELIAGLEAAVSAAPGNVPLRLHLIGQLSGSGRPAEALAHAEAIIRAHPDHADAMGAAAGAARMLGDVRAAAFERVARALDAMTGADRAAAPPRVVVNDLVDDVSTEWPAELELSVEEPAPARPAPARPAPAPAAADEPRPTPEPGPGHAPANAPSELVIDPSVIEYPQLTLRNIIGVDDVKRRIHEVILDPLRRRGSARGMAGGVLMFGPPGCGKGFFAKVIAGEMASAYLPVKLDQAMGWAGDPRQNVHRIFEAARAAAPCVLFLDHVDLAGTRPEAPEEPVDRRLLTRLATELGNTAANRGVLVLAGTRTPWTVDMALRADGVLDKTLLVLPPDEPAREAILRFHLRNTPLAGLDVAWIVQRTQHFSGDDLLLLCERARSLAAEDALGGDAAIGPGHMTRALREVRPTAPAWFSVVHEQALSGSGGSGLYDDVLAYIDANQLV